ncbi:DEAD/DEAH box helicase [Spirosoma endophyticum]|uniref:Helicase conserved C-terminal domain-containing protein n=1 Tax=Spirosoma endophyticum TaxID=662367 RepID=A0A1I1ZDF2_9BACT|nr:DEAD/DEAH box helicase [Spirosoma endophyticum]SFE29358.1 protein of unknown function [Spirosoma endophyticum]
MNVFTLHQAIIGDYKEYIHSFVRIDNQTIKKKVIDALNNGKFWKQPLIQFNPSFKGGQSVGELVQEGILHAELNNVFKGYSLYEHQVQAIRLGSQRKGFIVTSGTGSGKSLTFIGSIFNYIFQHQAELLPGVKAIIIYPMNALINSQFNELQGYADYYQQETGKPFPITFGQYTGQEKEEARRQMQANPPDILLTNYMMLELLLTRNNDGEPRLRQSIYDNLRFLAYDELHTFRGRQGADVALLTRRLICQSKHPITCIGTSATMFSGGSFADQKQKIAEVATLFFGQPFTAAQVIHESLEYSIGQHVSFSSDTIKRLINTSLEPTDDIKLVQQHPLAAWLEQAIALKQQEGQPVRNKPLTYEAIIDQLTDFTGCDRSKASNALQILLTSISQANVKAKAAQQKAVLPFKLHQFISQTGSVYMTLDSETITLEAGYFAKEPGVDQKPLFPVVFSRESGVAFFCLTRELDTLMPRDFDDSLDEVDPEKGVQRGYVIMSELDEEERDKIWNDDEISNLPDAWVNRDASGQAKSVVKKYRHRIPQKIYFNEQGNWSDDPHPALPIAGWFMPYKLPFDPTSGTIYDRDTSEGRKLTKLGSEGRSTSTTVLSFALLKQLALQGYGYEQQKVLSFTDNRQDAALQAGHFNDFINTVQIRAAIYRAVADSPDKQLDYSQIADRVVKTLELKQEDYAKSVGSGIGPRKENERALKDYLTYRILEDLKRSWRIVLPNLEQCGLIKIRYNYLEEQCEEEAFWTGVPVLEQMTAAERATAIFQMLDYFRKFYAINYEEYLSQAHIDTKRAQIIQKLIKPWGFEEKEQPMAPNSLRPTTQNPHGRNSGFTQSIAYSSAFGKYLRKLFSAQQPLKQVTYEQNIIPILNKLVQAGWLFRVPTDQGPDFPLYRLNVDYLIWQLGDGKSVDVDLIKNPSYKSTDKEPNRFFRDVYKTDFRQVKKLKAADHTGQITSTEIRKEREDAFRKGELSALYCSPTMELGIDISSLDVVHMRNVPPSPANYAQRSGRAGRSGQAALVFTYCSSYSPHDKHYYRNELDMVAGVVTAPQIDLTNEELLRSHLHAMFLAEVGMQNGNRSVMDLLDEAKPNLPLLATVREKIAISTDRQTKLQRIFERVIVDFRQPLSQKYWFTPEWITIQIRHFTDTFDDAFDRWRKLYADAYRQLQTNTQRIESGLYVATSTEFKDAQREQRFAQRQLDLLKNEVNEPNYISEFYPFRYLASEGFLPGYNFTRLPLRTFLEGSGGTGEFISRPRALALREFGPRNVIYHSGTKYEVRRLRVNDLETARSKAKVSLRTGYFLDGDEYERDICPFSGDALTTDNVRQLYVNLLEMAETRSQERDRITCEEEERVKQGYRIQTFFSVPGGTGSVQKATLAHTEFDLLSIQYIPTARLVHINEGWRNQTQDGFRLNSFGEWLANGDNDPANFSVQLYTYTNADALYIQPVNALNLSPDGVITLQYALKRAIETEFQIESSELGVQLMGNPDNPNIFLFESAEGSLGILSQLVSDNKAFHRVIDAAYKLCRFDDAEYTAPASYDDLLSYYNQRDHKKIDRALIREALIMMQAAHIELPVGEQFANYDDQFRSMLNQYDTNSTLERTFLEFLYANNLRLPDKAQARVDGIYSQPDFFYEPDFHVFIDGSVHDKPEIKEHDRKVRQAIKNRGEQCWAYRYDQNLAEQIAKRSDVFTKIR